MVTLAFGHRGAPFRLYATTRAWPAHTRITTREKQERRSCLLATTTSAGNRHEGEVVVCRLLPSHAVTMALRSCPAELNRGNGWL